MSNVRQPSRIKRSMRYKEIKRILHNLFDTAGL